MSKLISRVDWERVLVFAVLVALPVLAFAHAEHEATSLLGGATHPLRGADHLLAMVSVGIISALIGGSAIYWVPAMFVLFMMVGGIVGVFQVAIPMVEVGMGMSVVVLGAAIAKPRLVPVWATMLVVGCFGSMHGNAHGLEMPNADSPIFYTLGFLTTTSVIHVIGVLIGHYAAKAKATRLGLASAGLVIACVGVFFVYRGVA